MEVQVALQAYYPNAPEGRLLSLFFLFFLL
jgi:hypothetical protein